jgi:hypothetical protein
MDTTDRLSRLSRVLETAVDRSRSLAASGSAQTGPLLPDISPRLRAFTKEIEERRSTPEWDAVDGLAARLLLDDLAAALHSCRQVASDAASRLERVATAIGPARRLVKRETAAGESKSPRPEDASSG